MFIFSLSLIALTLVFDGTLFRLWSLNKDYSRLVGRIDEAKKNLEILEVKVERAKDPLFIRQQARDRFDYVEEDEMVFYFSHPQ